jgi:predicted ATPase/class 3 adenylate cyclase
VSVLPSGTVTFLFTDVEGSTRLLHELGAAAYAEALAEHRRVIREACAAEGGVEVDTQGDAFFFAFPTAPGALGAAAAFTEALASGPVSVRVGLHTGEPLLAAEGYVGKDVHLAARIAASAHGGQVVLSAATAELVGVRGSEPQALSLLELGEHRLKDVEGPVSLFQLGDGRFPPLKTIATTNLPTPASSFLGREHELYEADLLLQDTRLLTVTGPGGAGKTRFALELARRAREERFSDYPAGVFSCFFASLRDPALLLPTIAQTLSIKEQPGQSALDALSSHLEGRQMLLLLDNLEHLLEAAPQLAALLERCGRLTILCTSRELLRLRGERAYALPPLDEQEAVALFCERASVEPSAPIRELSLRLEGLPLALELAAARLAILTPEQLLERLSQRLDLFKGPRDADPRQQTLRATIEWSYDLLAEEERRLFRALSFFAGGCTLEAAERVADAVLDTLQSLVEKSLLRFTDGRYRMLETIREYAAERLEEAGAAENVQRRHADFVLRLSREVAEASGTRPELLSAFAREQDNFRAAFAWLGRSDRSADRLELIGETWPFWADRGSWFEGMGWVESALRHSEAGSALRAKVLLAGAGFAYRLGDLDTVQRYADEGSRLSAQLGDVLVRARSGMFLALVAAERGMGIARKLCSWKRSRLRVRRATRASSGLRSTTWATWRSEAETSTRPSTASKRHSRCPAGSATPRRSPVTWSISRSLAMASADSSKRALRHVRALLLRAMRTQSFRSPQA